MGEEQLFILASSARDVPSVTQTMLQEQEHLRSAMGKLASLAPDVLLVERSVARDAQDALLQLNVSLALNVKRSMLDRLARCTGAQVQSQMLCPRSDGLTVDLWLWDVCSRCSRPCMQVAASLDLLTQSSMARCQEFRVEHVAPQVPARLSWWPHAACHSSFAPQSYTMYLLLYAMTHRARF